MLSNHSIFVKTGCLGAVLVILLAAVLFVIRKPFAEDQSPYCLPVLADYEVCWSGANAVSDKGQFALVQRSGLFGHRSVLAPICSYALSGRYIVGTTPSEYYLVDTEEGRVTVTSNRQEWEDVLAKNEVPTSVSFRDPHRVAASMPAEVLRPREFIVMRGRLGLTDRQWDVIVQMAGVAASAFLGLCWARIVVGVSVSATIGLAAALLSPTNILEGGPGALGGAITHPVICCAAWYCGRLVGKLVPSRVGRASCCTRDGRADGVE